MFCHSLHAIFFKSLLKRFVKRELLQDVSPLKLTKLDAADKANWVSTLNSDIGLGAECAIKVIFIYIHFQGCMYAPPPPPPPGVVSNKYPLKVFKFNECISSIKS